MKFCKNCGHEAEDGKIRCPYCGYLFEDEMDNVLREINASLGNYKNELTASQAQAPVPVVQEATAVSEPVISGNAPRESESLKLEIANLKGQISAMQGELNRMSQRGGANTPSQVIYHAPQQPNTYAYPAPGVYSQAPQSVQDDVKGKGAKGVKAKKERKKSRIVLAIISLLLLAASVASFFFVWVSYNGFDGFKGVDAIKYIFGMGGESFFDYCEKIWFHAFPGPAFVPTMCKYICTFIVKYGVVVYAALLVLSLPILFSLGGRVRFKAWHAFFAWTSALVALLIFGVIFWVSGFSVMSFFFLGGAAANVLRGIFLLFYR